MNSDIISDFLAEERDQVSEELQPLVLKFEEYWERKLWHELTDVLLEFFNHSDSAEFRIRFYNTFVLKFADKINQLKLVDLALKTASQCRDKNERLAFMESTATKVNKANSQDAYVFAAVAVAKVKLELDDEEGARKGLEKAESILDKFDSVETVVHAAFYRVNADYYKAKMDFTSYYRTALLYLACIDLSSLSLRERLLRANDLALAALVSSSIYNFGELLLHPILEDLNAQPSTQWLRELLFAFNRGDLLAYEKLSDKIDSHPLLSSHSTHLRQKIYLAALTEAVFRRPPHDRNMDFDTISVETKVDQNEIEHLIMKALSLGLLRGTIDQVDRVANINWVQPKVLDMKQIENMSQRLKDWDSSVNNLGNWIEKTGQDVWAA